MRPIYPLMIYEPETEEVLLLALYLTMASRVTGSTPTIVNSC